MTDPLPYISSSLAAKREMLRTLDAPDHETAPGGWGDSDSVDAAQAYEANDSLALRRERLVLEIRELVGAIERVQAGTYGRCEHEACGAEIPAARMRAVPTARLCVAHQADLESRASAALRRRGYAPIREVDEPPDAEPVAAPVDSWGEDEMPSEEMPVPVMAKRGRPRKVGA